MRPHFNAKETYIQQKRDQHSTQKRPIFILNTRRNQYSAQKRPMSTNTHTHTELLSWADKRDLYPLIRTHAPYYYKCTHTLYYYHAHTQDIIINAHTHSLLLSWATAKTIRCRDYIPKKNYQDAMLDYQVATISRILKIRGLFCRILSFF